MKRSLNVIALVAWLGFSTPVVAQPELLQQRVEAQLRAVGPGPRFGLVVAADDGREVIAIAPEARFIPASNTKIFTTAAAFANLEGLQRADSTAGTAVRLTAGRRGRVDVILVGRGGAGLSSAADCRVDCLTTLADAVAAKVRTVGTSSATTPISRTSGGARG